MNFKTSPSGRVIKAGTGYLAFVPNPLPPQIEWTSELVNSLSRADHMLGRLSKEGSSLQNPFLFTRPFIAREAVLSSKIEGTRSTLEDMLINDVDATTRDGNEADRKEVQNYIDALSHGMQRLAEIPLSLRLIKEIHEILMRDVRGNYATPGEFRRSQNWIGAPGSTLMTAKFVPPTPEELMPALGALEIFLHDRTLPPLIHAGLCHYQFEAIHPFLDGNGRVGRLLIILLLIEQKVLSAPLLYISAFFEATRTDYYNGLYNVSAHGNWHEWLIYFLNGVALQSTDALSRIERINVLIQNWQTQAATTRSTYISQVIQKLAANPFITANSIAENTEIAFTTAQRIIQHLESLGIVTQRSEGKRDRLYCATQILAILEEPTLT
jgi:Fic family protein